MAGTWTPGEFPPGIALAAKLALLGSAGVRGADLFFGDSESTARRLSAVESAAPLWVWGLILITCCTAGYVGIILRYSAPILAAHTTAFVVYSAFSAGIVEDVARREGWDWRVTAGAVVAGIVVFLVVSELSAWRGHELGPLINMSVAVVTFLALMSIQLDGLRNASVLITVAIMHALLALGTASHRRQAKIERELLGVSGD